MRKFLGSIAALGLAASVSGPMTASAALVKTVKAATVAEHATLAPVGKNHVHGTATLTLNTKSHVMTVVLKATGLSPKSTHVDHIHVGPQLSDKYILNKLVADNKGSATSTTVFHNVTSLGKRPWVFIFQGPDLKKFVNATVIAQGALK